MTTLATDSALTAGRGTPNAWSPGSDGNNWSQIRGSQSLSFAANKLVFTSTGSGTAGVVTYSTKTSADQEVLVNVTQSASNADMGGALARCSDNAHWYCAVIGESANTFQIIKDNNGFTTLANTPFTTTPGTSYTIRFRVTGTTLKAKVWQTGQAEPAAWTTTVTDSSLSSGGFGICGAPASTGHAVSFDTFSANDALFNQSTQATTRFLVRALAQTRTRASFRIRSQAAVSAHAEFLLKVLAFAVPMKAVFSTAQNLALAFSTTQNLTLAFAQRSTMAAPNSTITTSATLTDAKGVPVLNPQSITVTVTYPDGTTHTPAVSNLLNGVYSITYTLSSATGLCRELWNVVASDGTTDAEAVNLVPVTL